MKTVRVYRLQPTPKLFACLKAAQMGAAQVWSLWCEAHQEARMAQSKWPGRNQLQKATKGQFALHSQSVQMVVHAFLAAIETTRQLRQMHPQMKMKHPWHTKRFYPVKWPAQVVSRQNGRVVLPMGRGRTSLVLPSGNPHGIRKKDSSRHHNQCMALWEYGKDIDYLTHKSKLNSLFNQSKQTCL